MSEQSRNAANTVELPNAVPEKPVNNYHLIRNDPAFDNVYDELLARGYIAQSTDEDAIRELLKEPGTTFYIGFDPTADSLHIGHFIPLMIMAHLQKAGHRPIALIGGGTAAIGDPSGRNDMRQMMSLDTIRENGELFRRQLSILLDFSADRAIMVNNADWLLNLNYVSFIRDVGAHFSVNRMLAAECYKSRLEEGLTFLEFNYMLMQAYDFLVLNRKYNCQMQLGGNDQWSNIIAGTELIRRKENRRAFGLTLNLLTTSKGDKMGKTAGGAVWLDADKFPVFDFYQYLRNIDDADVINALKLLTFVPLAEIEAYAKFTGEQLNEAKMRLAFETTRLIHGEAAALAAQEQARQLFSATKGAALDTESLPTTTYKSEELIQGINIVDALCETGLTKTRSEARRLIDQGGVSVNEITVPDISYNITEADLRDGAVVIRRGRKNYHRIIVQ
ncbi:MAG: tyrosine--tRNA ligase [Clostridiaceae bacterium]|nr:tyrosine--tRNA ligase [Clostridiaceae bacterium]